MLDIPRRAVVLLLGVDSVRRRLRIYGECKESDLDQVHHQTDDRVKDVDEYHAGFAEEEEH